MMDALAETLLAFVPIYGAGLIFVITYLSCLALPVPSSLAMLAGGAFAAVGDLSLPAVASAALAGAVLGDQTGYALGQRGGRLLRRMQRANGSAKLIAQAQAQLSANGWKTVFLTRWLFSPLGPYVNFAAGAGDLHWRRFTSASVAGEGVWVLVYIGLGWGFAAQIDRIGALTGTISGAIAAAAVAAFGLRMLWKLADRVSPKSHRDRRGRN